MVLESVSCTLGVRAMLVICCMVWFNIKIKSNSECFCWSRDACTESNSKSHTVEKSQYEYEIDDCSEVPSLLRPTHAVSLYRCIAVSLLSMVPSTRQCRQLIMVYTSSLSSAWAEYIAWTQVKALSEVVSLSLVFMFRVSLMSKQAKQPVHACLDQNSTTKTCCRLHHILPYSNILTWLCWTLVWQFPPSNKSHNLCL